MNKKTIGLIITFVCLGTVLGWQHKRIQDITHDRDSYKNNTYGLLSSIEELRKDSTIQAYQMQTLSLTVDEYKQYRVQDAKTISELKVRLKQVSAIAKQEMEVNVPVNIPIKDSVIAVDSVLQKLQAISYQDDYMSLNGTIQNDSLQATFNVPINITQVLYKVPKHKFLWWTWGCKAVKQVIITNNPYVQLNYSEYIEIK